MNINRIKVIRLFLLIAAMTGLLVIIVGIFYQKNLILKIINEQEKTFLLQSRNRECETAKPPDDIRLKSLSSGSFNANKIIYLVSENETKEITENIYCGAPYRGQIIKDGNYKLIMDIYDWNQGGKKIDSIELNLGYKRFVEGMLHDGSIRLAQLDPNDSRREFLLLYQYETCVSERLYAIGYDDDDKQLILYKFGKEDSISVDPDGVEITKDKRLISRVYDRGFMGKYNVAIWRLGKNHNFELLEERSE